MEFRTVIPPVGGKRGLVNHGEPLLLIGSCFTDNIGGRLTDELFDTCVNPFGPIYNPLSILRAIRLLAANGGSVESSSLVERDGGRWVSTLFHSRVSGDSPDEAIARMNRCISEGATALRAAKVVIITLGTTRAFILRENGVNKGAESGEERENRVVANCHKLPASMFDVCHLTLPEVVEALRRTVAAIRSVNPGAEIIFTVSPLRYTEQGLHANQLSKATLLLAIDTIIREQQEMGPRAVEGHVSYFPAYEVMMDDLRDYRFYAEDMKHPTPQAVGYIYDLFKTSYFDASTQRLAAEAASLTRRLAHRPLGHDVAKAEAEKTAVAKDFAERHPELKHACERYLNNIFNDGPQHF